MSGDLALIDRAVEGDDEAFEQLALAHRPAALRLATVLLGDTTAAEDVSQEVLLRLRSALPGFRGDSTLKTWIYRVTVNLCRDHLRTRRRNSGEISLESASAHPALTLWERPDRAIDRARARKALDEAVSHLPPDQREVIRLRYGEEMAYPEIARITGLPQGTVASRVFRALKRLGRHLEPGHLEVLK